MMLLKLTQIVIYLLFFQLLYRFISQQKITDLVVVMLAVLTVTVGEALNLLVFKMAVYNGVEGIPLYIILGGSMVSWGIYQVGLNISKKYEIACPFCQILIIVGISLFLPLIEILGLETELWYWRRHYPIVSFAWFFGVWKFYFMFVTIPAIVGIIINILRKDSSCSCKKT